MSEDMDRTEQSGWRNRLRRRRGGSPRMTGRRRTLLRVGVVALVLLVVVVVPGYVASQPTFLQRYEGLNGEYHTWATSVHAQVSCQKCHARPGLLSQASYSAGMLGEFYLSTVLRSREPKLIKTPTNAACRSCHPDWRTVSPTGDLNIPHRAHVVVLNMHCVQCHEFLVHEKSPEGQHKPRMVACMKCHDGTRAKNACTTCHTDKAAPASHKAADWVVVHPDRQKALDCTKCHAWTERWCAECHSRRPRSHGAKWRSTHGEKVKTGRNCEVCHAKDFCVKCHGELPSLNFDPTETLVQ